MDDKIKVHIVMNSHLDPIWLWDLEQGIDEIIATARTACDLLDDYPELHLIRGESMFYETVEKLDLSRMVGYAWVTAQEGMVDADGARAILKKARDACGESAKRILIKGDAVVTAEAAEVFAHANVELVGNESQTVGPENAPMQVHKILLGKGIVLLEGVRLGEVPEGVYFLCAQPLSLGGADGAPCRAVLVSF